MNLFGLPFWIWGSGCLGVAAIYTIFWPRPRTAGLFTKVVLRWFHGLVWLLLGAACFIAPLSALGGTVTATALLLLALLSYSTYIVVLFRDRLARAKP